MVLTYAINIHADVIWRTATKAIRKASQISGTVTVCDAYIDSDTSCYWIASVTFWTCASHSVTANCTDGIKSTILREMTNILTFAVDTCFILRAVSISCTFRREYRFAVSRSISRESWRASASYGD